MVDVVGRHVEVEQRDEMDALVAGEVVELDTWDDRQSGALGGRPQLIDELAGLVVSDGDPVQALCQRAAGQQPRPTRRRRASHARLASERGDRGLRVQAPP